MKIQEFDYSVNLLQSILWQYNDATRLQSLLEQKQTWYDVNQSQFWSNWYRDVFDLKTANDFGLTVWAIILNIPLTITSGDVDIERFGFDAFRLNYTRGNYAPSSSGIRLTTEQRRIVLRLRYFQLVSRGAAPEINQFMDYVFGDLGNVYVLDGLDMTMTYVFTFSPSKNLFFVLKNFDVLPRPAGVGINFVVTTRLVFGFGPFRSNFNRGNFLGEV